MNWIRLYQHLKSTENTPIFLKNAKNKNQVKIKRIPNGEIQASRGVHFLHLVCQGGARAPLPPVSYATAWMYIVQHSRSVLEFGSVRNQPRDVL